ncbi:MAG: hypothetical protein FIA90_01660 [candidate division NC10 bacterium]|nr:hypothetical protein [Candidatus Methylomirabilis sp.]NJD67373.1 hypothetical protein [candidate division NC10 bacterium]
MQTNLGWGKVKRRWQGEGRRRNERLAAALVVLAIGFLLLAPDPHDHGDAGSLGGLLRLLLPSSTQTHDTHHSEDEPQPEANGSCPIHFWHQVAATGLLVALLLQFFFGSLPHNPPFVTLLYVTDLGSSHSRAPPVFLS